MLDHCSIMHKGLHPLIPSASRAHSPAGGIVLWSRSFTPMAAQMASSPASPVNDLIRDALIEGRTVEKTYEKGGYAVKWTFVNELELIFVVHIPPFLTRGLVTHPTSRSHTNACYSSHTSKNFWLHSRPYLSTSSSLSSPHLSPPSTSSKIPLSQFLVPRRSLPIGTLQRYFKDGIQHLTNYFRV